MNDNLTTLLAGAFTKPQAVRRLSLLHDFLNLWLFSNKQSLEAAITEFTNSRPEAKLIGSFDKTFLEQFNSSNMTDLLKQLDSQLNAIKLLTITLAVDLPETEISRLGQYLRTNFKEQFLMEIKLDPSLIAGAGLTYNGQYKDYSLKAKIAANRQAIIEDFKKGLGAWK